MNSATRVEDLLHTSGPWHVVDSWETWPGHAGVKNRDIYVFADDTAENSICTVASVAPDNTDIQQRELANARLIAAAPDLLEALRLMVAETKLAGNWDTRDYGWPKVKAAVIAALAKAEGK